VSKLSVRASVRFGYVTKVDFTGEVHRVEIDGTVQVTADTVIIATGATAKWLGLESEQKYNGFGVSACAVCDGFFFKNQEVAIEVLGIQRQKKQRILQNYAQRYICWFVVMSFVLLKQWCIA
jgi:thioredoxin reductase